MVSVIIPCFNSARWIERTIASCLSQGNYVKEIIVIDDHSSDESFHIVSNLKQQFPEKIKLESNPKKGGNNARNYGFKISTGDFIQWLDADDQIVEGKLKAQLAAFESHPSADIIYSDWQLNTYDEKQVLVKTETRCLQQYADFLSELINDNWSPPLNYLVKRGTAQKLSKMEAWNPKTLVFQDREYFTKAAIIGAVFYYAPGVFSIYNRWNGASVSQQKAHRTQALKDLFIDFKDLINKNESLTASKRNSYNKLIITNKILNQISGWNMFLRDPDAKYSNINWSIVNGLKSKFRMFVVLIYNFLYYQWNQRSE